MMDLSELITRGLESAARGDEDEPKMLDPEIALFQLREAFPRYTRKNPFKVGDVVTPVSNSNHRGHGNPRLVIAVRDPVPDFDARHIGELAYGYAVDVKVIYFGDNDTICARWCESTEFEPFPG
jgi:hypothetical protein